MHMSSKFAYKIEDNLGVISTSKTGWTKELNIISWNDHDPKFDIREWSPDHQRMTKGLTFNWEEAIRLKRLMEQIG